MKLYFHYMALHVKSRMAYRWSFFIECLGQLLLGLNLFLGLVFLTGRFGAVGGYTLRECALCCGTVLMASSLAECFGRGFDRFAYVLSSARFDRLLVQPRPLMLQILCTELRLNMLPRVAEAAVMIVWGAGAVRWTAGKGSVLLLMILGGAGVFFGLFILYAALCFFTLEGLEVMNIFTDGAREYGRYPFGVYGKGVLWLLTLLVPLALCQHWPLQYLLDRGPWQYGLLPLLAPLFLIPCLLAWRTGVRRYRSTGS